MKRFNTAAWMALVVVAVCCGTAWAATHTQPAAATTAPAAANDVAGVGTVSGDNVYVRSGFSTNYYPVIKLHKGDKVTVLRSEYGWLEILPPAGAFSLVEKNHIDRAGDTGTANDLTQVYAGSDLDKRHYAKQVKLAKGDKVQIIGETSEGDFYKITPPAGATVWITADFVKRGAAGETAKIEPVKDLKLAQAELTKPDKKTAPAKAKTTETAAKAAPKQGSTTLTEDNRVAIKALEAEIAAEMTKAPSDQRLEPFITRLQKLADQKDDIVAQTYAKARMRDLNDRLQLAAAIREMKELREKTVSEADAIAAERAKIQKEASEWKVNDIVARGEIRVSGLYDGAGGKAKRWRLVDPKSDRTIAYLELPPGSPIDPVQFYGRFVGVKATSYELLHGTVPPLPVYVVSDIEVQDPNAPVQAIIRKDAIASSASPAVPDSQPAAGETASTKPAEVEKSAEPAAK